MSVAPVGVLLMAYGSPTSPDDLEAYYTDIRRGRPPTPELLAELAGRYRQIGGVSPLTATTLRQAEALQQALDPAVRRFRVYTAMKHWEPRIHDTVIQMAADGIERAVGLVLAPHYSALSVGEYHARVREALAALPRPPAFDLVESWHLQPEFLEVVASRIVDARNRFDWEESSGLSVIFTAHSLPERILQTRDPYPQQLRETATAVARLAGLDRWTFAWQSAGRTNDRWLGPDLKVVMTEQVRAGCRAFLVCPVGFVADHMETLYDLDIDARAHAQTLGVHFERTDGLNASPAFIGTLADLVESRVGQAVPA